MSHDPALPWWIQDVRVCPVCGYAVTLIQITSARFDYPCPRCQGPFLSEFVSPAGVTTE